MTTTIAPDAKALSAARDFVARVSQRYPVSHSLMFGSRARGDGRADSDVDVALVMVGERGEMRRVSGELAGEAFDDLLLTGLLVTPFAVTVQDWSDPDGFSNPVLIRNIRREGIPL